MARRHTGIKAALVLGGLCAAGVVIYKNRDLLLGFVDELTGASARDADGFDKEEYFSASPEGENDIVIDRVTEDTEAENEDGKAADGAC
ncbi:MAG: hypothetical protein IJU29_09300 [Oscillospiraceae bacterium]|nr:hypothetical protein [Oscillospiraceae bacterium]